MKKIILLLLILLTAGFAKAASSNELPEIMVGQTTVSTSDGKDYYGGFPSNEVVYNKVPSGQTIPGSNGSGYTEFGFLEASLAQCVSNLVAGQNCFISNSTNTNVLIMNSKTYVNGSPAMELATLLYPSKPMIVGDSYLGSSDPNNFAFWGRNLALSQNNATSPDSFIGIGGYKMNKDAQASLDTSGTEYISYKNKIDALKGEGKDPGVSLMPQSNPPWFLQGSASFGNLIDALQKDAANYPEGKIWTYNGNLTIGDSKTFYGKGTIIVYGNLTINSGVQILPSNDKEDRLGFIVYGPANSSTNNGVNISKNTNIQASILSLQHFNINGDNVKLTGSFVAKDFPKLGDENNGPENVHFYYDYNLDNAWPPGFRSLKMPQPNN